MKKKRKKPNKSMHQNKHSQQLNSVGLREQEIYRKNLKCLKKYHPELAKRVDQVSLYEGFQLEKTGEKKLSNLFIPHLNSYYYSPGDPEQDVEQQISDLNLKNAQISLFLGIGLGYELIHYLKNISEIQKTKHVLIIEKNLGAFKYALCVSDFTEIFVQPKIVFKVGLSKDDFFVHFVDFLQKGNRLFYIKAIQPVYHLTALKLEKDYYLQALKSIREAGVYQVTYYGNAPHDSLIGIDNMLKNITEIVKNPGINMLYNKFKGKPAVIVSTGPSLNKNKHLLKGLEDKAIIICPDASLRILLDMGVKPHLVTSLERVPATVKLLEGFDEKEVEDIYFAGCPVVMKEAYEVYPGPRVIVYREYGHFEWLNIDRGMLDIKHSSGNMAFKLGEALGCDPIILVGQDLAYSREGTSHASGTFYGEKQFEVKQSFEVMGNDGKPIFTNRTWNIFRQAYEVDVAKYKGMCINSTEGGAYINGTKVIAFQEAISKHVHDSFNPLEQIKKHLSLFSTDDTAKDAESARKVIDDSFLELKEMVSECEKGLSIHSRYEIELTEYLNGIRVLDKDSKSKLLNIQQELSDPKEKIKTNYQYTFQLLIMHVIQSFHINFEINMNEIPGKHDNEEAAMAEVLLHQNKWYFALKDIIRICMKLILESKVELFGEHALTEDQGVWLEKLKTKDIQASKTNELEGI